MNPVSPVFSAIPALWAEIAMTLRKRVESVKRETERGLRPTGNFKNRGMNPGAAWAAHTSASTPVRIDTTGDHAAPPGLATATQRQGGTHMQPPAAVQGQTAEGSWRATRNQNGPVSRHRPCPLRPASTAASA